MFAYIIRRSIYAIPTLIGVNLLVFMLFFFVNSPDNMARAHGGKRVTQEWIDEWKREHSLDLPYFYNDGWRRIGALAGEEKENKTDIISAGSGKYALIVETAAAEKKAQARTVRLHCSQPGCLVLPAGFDKEGRIVLPTDKLQRRFTFEITPGSQAGAPVISLGLDLETPSPANRIVLEYQADIGLASRFTQTIFFQRSVKMLAFKYGKSDDGKDITEEILGRMGPSLSIAIPGFLLGLIFNVCFAMITAFYRGTYVDYWGVILCVLLMSISTLFYILAGQVIIGKYFHLVPISGYGYGMDSLKFVILPVAIVIISELGGGVRFLRTIFLEEINKDYVRTARAKGLPEAAVLFVHALKNAMLPILTNLGASLLFLFTGDLLLESFFAVPGMGSFTLDGIQRQDFAVVQAMVCLDSFIYIVALMLTDISYTLFDPRVRLE